MSDTVSAHLDRLVICAVDVVDGEPTAGDDPAGRDAVRAALQALVEAELPPTREARLTIVVHRLARWTARSLHVLARSPVRTSPEQITGTWGAALGRGDSTVADLLWTTATAVTDAVVERRLRWRTDDDALAGVLHEVCPPAPAGRSGPWAFGPVDGRSPRYELRAGFEPGSGVMLWPANEPSVRRWGRTVDHFDLPIPWSLAERLEQTVGRYDDACLALRPTGRRWADGEWYRFVEGYLALCEELVNTLGPAYRVVEARRPEARPL